MNTLTKSRSLHFDTLLTDKNQSVLNFAILDSLSRLSYRDIGVANLVTKEVLYVSEGCEDRIGLSRNDILEHGLDAFKYRICEKDQEIFDSLLDIYNQFFRDGKILDPSKYTLSFDVRLKKRIGSASNLVHCQLTPVDFYGDTHCENLYICMTSLSPNKESGVIEMMDRSGQSYWQYSFMSNHWHLLPHITLKNEEIEVIRLSAQGLSILEMSSVMNKSFDTIKFYRKILFKKLGVENITEAVSYAVAKQLI